MNDSSVMLDQLGKVGLAILITVIGVGLLLAALYGLLLWFKFRKREEYALGFVTLMVRVPRDNETKIDAADQMFNSLFSLKKAGAFSFLTTEELLSFEIVALKESIVFYVSCPHRIRDFVEKQIHGAYPNANIDEVDEVNIFSKGGRVAFAALNLERASYFPIKNYKDLPTDGLSLITSALSKMGDGEGAMIQFLIEPEGDGWRKKGKSYIQGEKKREADPEKATYTHDPKELESVANKVEKRGFRISIRVVVSSPTEYNADAHLQNIIGSFAQFTSPYNAFKQGGVLFKHMFMIDFIYRYMPLFNKGTFILNAEELEIVHL